MINKIKKVRIKPKTKIRNKKHCLHQTTTNLKQSFILRCLLKAKLFLKNSLILKIWALLLFFSYLLKLLSPFIKPDYSLAFGYLDESAFWEALNSFVKGKVIYRDFIWDYGILYLIIGSPIYLLLSKTFFSVIFIKNFIFPLLGVILSIIVAKLIFKNYWFLLFLSLLLVFNVNTVFTSFRHLLPELALILFLISIKTKSRKKLNIASFLIGLSFLNSIDYAIASLIIFIFINLYLLLKKTYPFNNKIFLKSILIVLTPPFIYLAYLYLNKALPNFIIFHTQISSSFYENSPCGGSFPRLINLNFDFNNLNALTQIKLILNTLYNFNLYLLPLFLFFILIYYLWKSKKNLNITIITLILFYFITYYRLIVNPCTNLISYNLTFLIFAVIFIYQKSHSNKFKLFLFVASFWFLLTHISSANFTLIKEYKHIISNTNNSNSYDIQFGIPLAKNISDDYLTILNHIKNNTQKNDYVLDYPNGIYHLLAERRSPINIPGTCYYNLVPDFVNKTLENLVKNNPKYIIVNTANGISCNTDINYSNKYLISEDQFFINGPMSPVEEFIVKNYEIDLKNSQAILLKKRSVPLENFSLFLPIKNISGNYSLIGLTPISNLENYLKFQIEENKPQFIFNLNPIENAYIGKITFKLTNTGKPFNKHLFAVITDVSNNKNAARIATGDWQEFWFYLPENIGKEKVPIFFLLSLNQGFLPLPVKNQLWIKSIEIYKLNNDIFIQ